MPNKLAGQVEETLRPIVGTVLASVSVDLEAKRIGKSADTITNADLEVLAKNLTSQLRKFVGDDLAQAAALRVRQLG